MGPLRQIFSSNLVRERKSAGITQVELAERTRISLSSIVKYESGKVWPGDTTSELIADALSIPASRLYLDRSLVDPNIALEVIQKALNDKS